MRLIRCNPANAKALLLKEPGAIDAPRNPNSYELWRIQFNDAVAVGYERGVLPQGKNPQRIADSIKSLDTAQFSF